MLKKYHKSLRVSATKFFDEYAHITYTVRVATAVAVGLFGVGVVYALSDAGSLAAFRSSLTAAVAGTAVIEEVPIVLSGVSVQGEVVPARELALSARASGIIANTLRVGDRVGVQDIVLRIDDTEARRTQRSAETSLAAARLSIRINVADSVAAHSNDVATREEAAAALVSALQAGHEEISSILPLLPDVISGLSGMLYGGGFSDDGVDYLMAHAGTIEADNEAITPFVARAGDEYIESKRAYESVSALFLAKPNPTDAERETFIVATDNMLETLSGALSATEALFSFIKNHRASLAYNAPPVFAEYEESLTNYVSQVDEQQALIRGTRSLVEAARAVVEGEASFVASSPESAELEVRRAELELEEASARLAGYELRAPFAGTIARLDKRTAQYVEDGETFALLIARENVVQVWLAQGEAARVNVGTRALVSIAGADISVPGVIEEMDVVGKKNEDGDIVFGATISFPKEDERIKPGMQVTVGFEQGGKY